MTIDLKGSVRCRKCGAYHPHQGALEHVESGQVLQCANPDCKTILVDLRDGKMMISQNLLSEGGFTVGA